MELLCMGLTFPTTVTCTDLLGFRLPVRAAIALHKIRLATFDGSIANPEITIESAVCDAINVHGSHTKYLHRLIHDMW